MTTMTFIKPVTKPMTIAYFACNIWMTFIVLINWVTALDSLWIIPGIWALVTNYGAGMYYRNHDTAASWHKFSEFSAKWCCFVSSIDILVLCLLSIVTLNDPAITIGGIAMIVVTFPIGIIYLMKRTEWMDRIAKARHY